MNAHNASPSKQEKQDVAGTTAWTCPDKSCGAALVAGLPAEPGKRAFCPRCGKPMTAAVGESGPNPDDPATEKRYRNFFWYLSVLSVVVIGVLVIWYLGTALLHR